MRPPNRNPGEPGHRARPAFPPGKPAVGALLRLRKPHACGGLEWRIDRVGADVGLCCRGCGRRVLLSREELGRRVSAWLPGVEDEA